MSEKVNVQKNGIPGTLHKTTWERIGGHSNKEGWVLVAEEPEEVLAIREKKANQAGTSNLEENAIAEKSESFNPEGEIKQLKKEKVVKKK